MNLVKTCFLFLLSLNSVFCVTDSTTDQPDNYVEIPTSLGYLRGVRVPTKQGFYVDYFKGVPFAEKPERLRVSVRLLRVQKIGIVDKKIQWPWPKLSQRQIP
ncbi:hypothetical protein B9Z55_005881 [Caenorhabditis nigoni]|uniref:Carboxylesterase type B domain-containing protein n=1 Tax=Caenorhabditis nigoni TaxID=1611254 RepID=A0A2G5V2R5_9PELO|nr:hypothetical protein B9Z55_005881 [Caenorhabditis nigoni]